HTWLRKTKLSKQSLLINKISKHPVNSVMRVLVIRRDSIKTDKNSRHKDIFRMIILVDKEMHIETRNDFLKPNNSCHIVYSRLNGTNPNYSKKLNCPYSQIIRS
ncbi:hypothetical protein H5410_041770, partial [Solanum commersonii]